MEVSGPNLYPMRLVTKMTGLSADTIRAWERRHGAVSPARTEGNTRRYTSQEVRRLLLLREATRRGHSIGSIANLGARALERLLAADQPGLELLVGQAATAGGTIDELGQAYVGALCRYDARTGLDLLIRSAGRLDRTQLVQRVLVPVAREVESRWSVTSVGTSHRNLFVHHLHALAGAISRQRGSTTGEEPRVIVAAEDRGRPEVVSLMTVIFLSRADLEPVYAGYALRRPEVEWALEMSQASALVYVGLGLGLEPRLPVASARVLHASDPDWTDLGEWASRLSGRERDD